MLNKLIKQIQEKTQRAIKTAFQVVLTHPFFFQRNRCSVISKYTRLALYRFTRDQVILHFISKILYIGVFKLYEIKKTKPLLFPHQYVKSRENVIGGCALTRDDASLFLRQLRVNYPFKTASKADTISLGKELPVFASLCISVYPAFVKIHNYPN